MRLNTSNYLSILEKMAENEDGSLYAHIPVKWIRINPPAQLTEEQQEKRTSRILEYGGNSKT